MTIDVPSREEHDFLAERIKNIEAVIDTTVERVAEKVAGSVIKKYQIKEASQDDPDELLTVNEFAALAKLSIRQVQKMKSRREIGSCKFDKSIRFKRSDVKEWIESHYNEAEA